MFLTANGIVSGSARYPFSFTGQRKVAFSVGPLAMKESEGRSLETPQTTNPAFYDQAGKAL